LDVYRDALSPQAARVRFGRDVADAQQLRLPFRFCDCKSIGFRTVA